MSDEQIQDGNRPSLTFANGVRILTAFSDACEKAEEYAATLSDLGFRASVPWYQWSERYCLSEADRKLNKVCTVEEAKEAISRKALVLAKHSKQEENLYKASLLLRLKKELEEINGMPECDLEKHFSLGETWIRRQYNPCQRNAAIAEQGDPQDYENSLNLVREAQWAQFNRETKQHATGLVTGSDVTRIGRCRSFSHVVEHCSEGVGFGYDKTRSTRTKPCVSRNVTENWDLIWRVPDTSTFDGSTAVLNNRNMQSRFAPELAICSSHLKEELDASAKQGDFLILNYHLVIKDFTRAYYIFLTNDEFEAIIRAHMALIKLLMPMMLTSIRNGTE